MYLQVAVQWYGLELEFRLGVLMLCLNTENSFTEHFNSLNLIHQLMRFYIQ